MNAAFELADQIESGELPEPDVVYVPFGSMGTAAGLAIGFAAEGIGTRVQAVRVLPPASGDAEALARTVAEAVGALSGVDAGFPRLEREDVAVDVRGEFLGEGYAVPTLEALEAVELAAESGLALETTYTGKALAALAHDADSGKLDGATCAVLEHLQLATGGAGESRSAAAAASRACRRLRHRTVRG